MMHSCQLQLLGDRKIMMQAGLAKNSDLISKITNTKRAKSIAQVEKYLFSKQEALSSISFMAK
jgi:hypothetical protein